MQYDLDERMGALKQAMEKEHKKFVNPTELRRQAEERLRGQKAEIPPAGVDALHLIYELEVHQIELEMQNDELQSSQAKLEDSLEQYSDLYDFAPLCYFSLGPDGTIQRVNLAGASLLGFMRSELVNRRFGLFVTIEQRLAFHTFLQEVFSTKGNKLALEICLEAEVSAQRWVHIEAAGSVGKPSCKVALIDITARRLADENLRAALAELQAANITIEKTSRAKDEFLSTMSHELLTPLTGILGLAQVLQLNAYGDLNEKQMKAIQNIELSGQRLNTLVNSILNFSRLQSGKQELNILSLPLIGVCKASLKKFEKLAADRQQALHFDVSPLSIILKADEQAISQILDNLLSNALKFTPPGGTIDLKVSGLTVAGQVRISVSDTGIGIQEEDLPRLFQPFQQLDTRLSRAYDGAGLGLALVKLLAELHGGSVEVESVFGQGSCFTVVLPWHLD